MFACGVRAPAVRPSVRTAVVLTTNSELRLHITNPRRIAAAIFLSDLEQLRALSAVTPLSRQCAWSEVCSCVL